MHLTTFRRTGALAAFALTFALPTLAAAASVQTLYNFPSSGAKGCYPDGTLLRDSAGVLYGATFICGAYNSGTLFRLNPPDPGQTNWTLSLLYVFRDGNDGSIPASGLIMDGQGALYGTTEFGGRDLQGVVYKLAPPAPGSTRWTQTVLHDFHYNFAPADRDGANPGAGLLMDGTGALYGTTIGGGNPSSSGPGYGTVFKLTPPGTGQTEWKEKVLYRFAGGFDGWNPLSVLTADATGALYGTTLRGGKGPCTDDWGYVAGCGTIFKLTPPPPGQTAWKKTTIYRFAGGSEGGQPRGRLLIDSAGSVYGTTYQGGKGRCTGGIPSAVIGCGTVFKLAPPAPGQRDWRKSVLHDFAGTEGAFPQGGVIEGASGALYGTASAGGSGAGTAFKLSPPLPGETKWTLTVLHKFSLLTSGENPVGELAADPAGHLFGVAYLGGPSYLGTVFKITP